MWNDSESDDWRYQAEQRALTSEKKCFGCLYMTDKCSRWHYTKEHAVGVNNQAPFCQFYTKQEGAKIEKCPNCGANTHNGRAF